MQTYIFNATCTHVVDGDTIDCMIDLGFNLTAKHRLRLHGVNTNEMHDNRIAERLKATEAKQFVKDKVLNKKVRVQTYKSDVFGRYLARVFVLIDGTYDVYECLNDLLIGEELAIPYMEDTELL
jgi:micrococcal nuclease